MQAILKEKREIVKHSVLNRLKKKRKVQKEKFSPEAIQLFGALDAETKKFIVRRFQEKRITAMAEHQAYDYFISHSPIVAATVANKGSSVTTEFLYDGPTLLPQSEIDKYFLRSKAGKAVKSRLEVIEEELFKIIKEIKCKRNGSNEKILIANLGSGPGRDTINVLADHPELSDVRAVNIDKDKKALERGEWMAKIRKVNKQVEFVEANFLKYNLEKKFDIVLLIGVLCPLPIPLSTTILHAIRKFLKPNGYLIASNASKNMESEDPFTCFLMDWTAGWKLRYKNEYELKQIYQNAGYIWQRSFKDKYGFHIMGVGTCPTTN